MAVATAVGRIIELSGKTLLLKTLYTLVAGLGEKKNLEFGSERSSCELTPIVPEVATKECLGWGLIVHGRSARRAVSSAIMAGVVMETNNYLIGYKAQFLSTGRHLHLIYIC